MDLVGALRTLVDQLRPAPAATERREAELYATPALLGAFASTARSGLTDSEAPLAARYVSPGTAILDIGCGAGREALGFARLGARVTGIDVCAEMLDLARGLVGEAAPGALTFEPASISDFLFPRHSFDVVFVSSDVYQCVPGRRRRALALERCRAVLRPGGVLILAVHAYPGRRLGRLVVDGAYRLLRPLAGARIPEPGDRWQRTPWAPPRYRHRFFSDAEVRAELEVDGLELALRAEGHFVLRETAPRPPVPLRAAYRARDDVRSEPVGDDLLLVQLGSGEAFTLNRTGRRIWELAAGGQGVDEIALRLHRDTAVPVDRLHRDVEELLEQLAANDLVDRA